MASTHERPRNGTVYVFLDGGGNTYLYLPAYINESLGPLKLRPVFSGGKNGEFKGLR